MTESTSLDAGPPLPRVAFRGRIIEVNNQVRQLANGKSIDVEYAERSPGVRIVVTDGVGYLITREWRDELGRWDYRLPGGKVFDRLEDYAASRAASSVEANAQMAAAKELVEEARISAPPGAFVPIYKSVAGATVVWDLYYYLLHVSARISDSDAEITAEGEHIAREFLTPNALLELIVDGKFGEDRSAALLMRLLLGGGKAEWTLPPAPEVQWR